MTRCFIAMFAIAAALPGAAVAQTPTLKLNAPPVAAALGEPVAKTWSVWQDQQARVLALVPKGVGDVEEPELGLDFTKIPSPIPTNVDVASLLTRTGPAGGRIPPSASPDVVGAFRFICLPGQISYDDPIVFPGEPGKSHLHQWFGNTAANAHSTYASLRTTGESTCDNILNRSAYWMPAMLDGKGHVVRPDYVTIYYKRRPESDPECNGRFAKACVALPRGLRMIFGYDMVTDKAPTGSAYFNCDGPTAKPGHHATITEAAKNCPAGNRLGAVISAPDCWDGSRLDSKNHRDHLAYGTYRSRKDNSFGYTCPDDHPYAIPSFTLGAWYSVDEARADSWYLSSDEMPGMERMPAGSTFHADWFGAWDDDVMAAWTQNCINKMLNCSTGELGDGRQMKRVWPNTERASPRLIPVPPRPARS